MKWRYLIIFLLIALACTVSGRIVSGSEDCIPLLEKCVGATKPCCPPSRCFWYANKCVR
ncbi:toxin Iob1-like [Rhodnius prolixus]|uniref:toxin Iob1-like n=1 Tax=Rhodnius prolixus TaxID=13249 RepID=UPI003D187F6B